MKRKLFPALLVLALLAPMFLSPPFEAAAQQPRPRRVAPRTDGATTQRRRPAAAAAPANQDARLRVLTDAYLAGHFAFNPSEATAQGLHDYDAALESRSRDDVAREVRRLRGALAELSRIREGALSTDARYDYLVVQSHARAQLLELEEIRMWQRDPNVYNGVVAASIGNILKRQYATIEQRLGALLSRERQIARLLDDARVNLENPPRIYTEIAQRQVQGNIEYFTSVVPQMFERAGGGRLNAARRAEFSAANENVIATLRSFAEWLERDLLPRSTGQFAIGAENFRRKLLYDEMVETPVAQLIRDGQKELRRTQDEMRALAEEIAPGRGVQAALQAASARASDG